MHIWFANSATKNVFKVSVIEMLRVEYKKWSLVTGEVSKRGKQGKKEQMQ